MKLSPHFDSREFAAHGAADVPAAQRGAYGRLCRLYLEPLRREFGQVAVTSGLRTVRHNADVGGAPRSFHVKIRGRRGVAADVVAARGTPREWFDFLDRLGVPGLGLYSDHVHADTRRGRARW